MSYYDSEGALGTYLSPDYLESSFQPSDFSKEIRESLEDFWNHYMNEGISFGSETLDRFASFQQTPVGCWSGEECVDWATFVCQRRGISLYEVDLAPLRKVTGTQLLHFKIQHFGSVVSDVHSADFFEELQVLKRMSKKLKGKPKTPKIKKSPSTQTHEETDYGAFEAGGHNLPPYYSNDLWHLSEEEFQALEQYCPEESLGESSYTDEQFLLSNDLLYLDLQKDFIKKEEEDAFDSPSLSNTIPEDVMTQVSKAANQKVKTKTRRGERGAVMWEFLIRLLMDSNTNPALVKWDDETEGTFLLVQPEIIARLWGSRSNKPNLSYNNFARGLSYHYNTGAIEAVPEHNFMYRCGPKAVAYLKGLKK